MRDAGYYLGFRSLVLLFACVVAPVIGLLIRRKWRLSVTRKEEIKRLVAFAAEEAARAELEASAGYGASGASSASSVVPISTAYHQCAVCYSPTTTRCSRCKAVRYCSGKCQIIHWRQGHREDCHPSSDTHRIRDVGSKVTERDNHESNGDCFETEGRQHAYPIKTLPGEPVLSNSGHSPEFPCEKAYGIKDEFLEDSEGTNSASESSGTSFSGFSASTASVGVSDDVSVCESISSNESGGSDVHLSVDNPLDILETGFSVKNMNQGKPLLPKFASLVDSVDHLANSSKHNPTKPDCSDVVGQCASTSSSGSGISRLHEDSIAQGSDFRRSALDPNGSTSDSPINSALSNSNGANNRKFSDSRSVLRFSFNLSESTSPLHAQGAEVKGTISDDALLGSSEITKPVDGADLSENISVVAPKAKNSASLNHDGSSCADSDTSDSHMLKSREVKSMASSSSYVHLSSNTPWDSRSADAPNVSNLSSLSFESSKHVAGDPGSTSHHLKSREVRCLSSNSSDARTASSAEEHSVPVVKSGKVDGVQAIAAISSQAASCPNARSGLRTSVRKVVDQFRGSKLSKHYPLGDGCEVAGRYTDKGLFPPYEVFVKLYNWNKVELRPCGLINSGNSCYANAVLQCLAFTPPLNAYFLQGIHSRACVNKEACFICEFESLILKAKEGKSPLSPNGILSQLKNVGSQLGNGREEDAHEFLRYAIDTMQSVFLKEASVSGSLEEETTLIGLTFGGYLRSKIKCTKCHGKSERQERMMDLTVEIEGDIGTLEEALHQFTRTEILDGENKYQCSRCKSYERAKKKLTVMEAPNILTIALKRFQSGKFGKLNKPIQFPEILDLAPFTSGTSDKSPIYKLYGVVVHLDIMNASFSGHYVCYVKNNQNKWFKIDDSSVTAVERERVFTKGAYMLLYARFSPRAPRLIRNMIISSDLKNKPIPSWINGKNTTSKSRSASERSSAAPNFPRPTYPDSSASVESCTRYPQLRRIIEEDSSSDNSSLISNNSDEGSCSTDSTRDSTSTDDLSDFIFGDSGRCWNGNSGNPSDSDTSSSSSSSSSSPLCSRQSPLSYSKQQASGLPETSGSRTEGSVPFWHSDTRHSRKLVTSSSYRETDSERLGSNNLFHGVNSGLPFRKSMRERTDY